MISKISQVKRNLRKICDYKISVNFDSNWTSYNDSGLMFLFYGTGYFC